MSNMYNSAESSREIQPHSFVKVSESQETKEFSTTASTTISSSLFQIYLEISTGFCFSFCSLFSYVTPPSIKRASQRSPKLIFIIMGGFWGNNYQEMEALRLRLHWSPPSHSEPSFNSGWAPIPQNTVGVWDKAVSAAVQSDDWNIPGWKSVSDAAAAWEFLVNHLQLFLHTGWVVSTSLPGYNYCCVSYDLELSSSSSPLRLMINWSVGCYSGSARQCL